MKVNLYDECNKIFNFWKLMEYFAPYDYPHLDLTMKRSRQDGKGGEDWEDMPFDVYYNKYNIVSLPLNNYKEFNEYLCEKKVHESMLYAYANIYCGCYKTKTFVAEMAKKCIPDMDEEKYIEINELTDRFYIFSVQVDLDGNITDEGVQVSPFFYVVVCMMKSRGINVNFKQEDIKNLNDKINEIVKQKFGKIKEFKDISIIKHILFCELKVKSDQEVGLEGATENIFACKGIRRGHKAINFKSFYLDEIEMVQKDVQKNCQNNGHVMEYAAALLNCRQDHIMIDSDIDEIKKWLDVERFPLAKYPSTFSPTLMQQVAINIAISEQDRQEKMFSVNGPPGTGKTTLLKEIIASNVEQLADVLISYGNGTKKFIRREIQSESSPNYIETYYEIPEEIAKFGILVASNNNAAVENITLSLPRASNMSSDNTRTGHFDRKRHQEIYFSAVADELLGESAWGLISARMGKREFVNRVLQYCVFSKSNDKKDKVTLDSERNYSLSWEKAVIVYEVAKSRVLSIRKKILEDQKILSDLYVERERLDRSKQELNRVSSDEEKLMEKLNGVLNELKGNEQDTLKNEEEIKYAKTHTSLFNKLLIVLCKGKMGEYIAEKQREIDELTMKHGEIVQRCNLVMKEVEEMHEKVVQQQGVVSAIEKKVQELGERVYGEKDSLKANTKTILQMRIFMKISKNLRIRRMLVHGHLMNMMRQERNCFLLHCRFVSHLS